MHPIAALMMVDAIEQERRRDQRHSRRRPNVERPTRSTTRSGGFGLARVFRLAASKA